MRRSVKLGWGLCALGMAAACSESGGTEPPPGTERYSLTATYEDVPEREERTLCQVLDLGNEEPAMVRSITTTLTAGSHHMIVDRTDDPVTTEPYPCGGIPGGEDTLFIAQQPEATIAYPDGAGLPIEAHQHVYIEVHYLNYLGEEVDIEGAVHFDVTPPDPGIEPVQILFTGPFSLDIPDGQETTVDSFHTVPTGGRVFALTSHMHQLGQWATIQRATSVGDPDAELLHESTDWADPPIDFFDPPLVFDPGEGLWITCHYDNRTGTDVGFGPGFDDEMCFLWAYWY